MLSTQMAIYTDKDYHHNPPSFVTVFELDVANVTFFDNHEPKNKMQN